ncbi:MAG: divergent PAP2 family protein [Faecalibacterium sp.]|jgi:acid phosphatase family membrane protein YuiD|nr:divergent PAP2 family protein [Faecalibacterium sp.]
MQYWEMLLRWNFILISALVGWLVAQVLKTLINCILARHFSIERMWGDGGMPSAHSATVCAMLVATGRMEGTSSAIFAIAFVVAIITMHDAMGVRRETGEQAKILNRMISEWMDMGAQSAPFLADKKLKEMVGHTPIEVISGAALGTLIGFVMPML